MHVILLGVAAIAVTACVGSSNAAAQAHTAATMKTPRPCDGRRGGWCERIVWWLWTLDCSATVVVTGSNRP
jgi:hypothetical protein